MKLNSSEKNALQAVEYLLWASKVNVSAIGLKEELCLHPDFPSMASVSDALSEWQVSNIATRLQTAQLKEVPLPALAYLKIKGGILAPIKSVNSETIEWLDTQNGWQKDSITNFEQKWDGVTLLLEPDNQSGEIDYAVKSKKQFIGNVRIPFLILGSVLCIALILAMYWNTFQSAGSYFGLSLSLKFAGMVLGGLLLWQSLDADNVFLQNICHFSNKNNCNSILQSQASKITSWLSWSEVGFIYFSGGFLVLLFGIISNNLFVSTWLAVFSLLSLPYTIYSIWYQRSIARQWCTLCMAVQLLLWTEAALVIFNYEAYKVSSNTETLLLAAIAFIIPALIWVLVKKPLAEAKQLFDLQKELQKVKFSEDYIQSAFSNQPQMPPVFSDMYTAKLGNPSASNMLTIVTNPLCGPCSRLHHEINKFLETNANIQCQYIFLGPPKALQIASIFLDPHLSDKKELMDSWYQNIQQDSMKWINNHEASIENNNITEQFQIHSRWCDLAGITGTPTVFINGIKLPTAFKIKDLKRIVSLMHVANDMGVTVTN
jgi:hypothetical protein